MKTLALRLPDKGGKIIGIRTPDSHRLKCTFDTSALEADNHLLPLNPFGNITNMIVNHLSRPGENLPLIVASHQEGSFRSSVVFWIEGKAIRDIENFEEIDKKLESWSGNYPDPNLWVEAYEKARRRAKRNVENMIKRAKGIEEKGLKRQIEAARIRLLKELGRYLVCVNQDIGDLNQVLSDQMKRDIASAQRLNKCLQKLGGYPDWPETIIEELREFLDGLTPNERSARLLGSQLDAALDDPRWVAADRVAIRKSNQ